MAGEYRSTIFIRPSPTDGPDTTHLRGDYVQMKVDEDGIFTAFMRTSYDAGGTMAIDSLQISGLYNANSDSVVFIANGGSLFLMPFKRVGSDLHGKIKAFGPYEIYLKRK